MADPFTILVVCTGNISRSPFASMLLADVLGPSVQLGSAGTRALAGHGVDAKMLPYYQQAGVDPGDFVARQLQLPLVRDADLILTMATAHRASVLDLMPAAVRRTFTLREFARLAAAAKDGELDAPTPGERLAQMIELVPTLRERAPRDPDNNDVHDPYGRDQRDYERAVGAIRAAVATIADAVGPQRPS